MIQSWWLSRIWPSTWWRDMYTEMLCSKHMSCCCNFLSILDFTARYSFQSHVHSCPAGPRLARSFLNPCSYRKNHHHVYSPHGWGWPSRRSNCHYFPRKALLLGDPTLPEELLWHWLLLDLGAQNENCAGPKERFPGTHLCVCMFVQWAGACITGSSSYRFVQVCSWLPHYVPIRQTGCLSWVSESICRIWQWL